MNGFVLSRRKSNLKTGAGRQLVFKGNVSISKMVVEEVVGNFHVSTSDPHRLVLHPATFMIEFASESVFLVNFVVGLNKV